MRLVEADNRLQFANSLQFVHQKKSHVTLSQQTVSLENWLGKVKMVERARGTTLDRRLCGSFPRSDGFVVMETVLLSQMFMS